MFVVNSEDNSIYVTRGDAGTISVTAKVDGANYVFKAGDVVRFKVTRKKDCENVVLQKDFPITVDTEIVDIYLSEKDTKIGDVISKPVDYWYEVELNPFTNPQTIIGYDDDGAKIFKLHPEGRDLVDDITEEDIPVVDTELSLTSEKPVQNQVIARAVTNLNTSIKTLEGKLAEEKSARETQEANLKVTLTQDTRKIARDVSVLEARMNTFTQLEEGSTTGDAELADVRIDFNGNTYANVGEHIRSVTGQLSEEIVDLENTLITEVFRDIEPYEEVTGVYWYKYSDTKASYASAAKYGHKKYNVPELHRKVLITTYVFDTENCYFFVDDDNNIIKSGLFSEHRCGVLVDVPNGATKLYVNYYVNATTTEFNPYGVKGVTCIPNVDKETSPKTLMIADDSYKGYYLYNSINNVVFNDNVDFYSYMKKVKQGDIIRLVGNYFSALAGYILTDNTMKPYFVKNTTSSGSASYDDTITIEKDGYVFYTEYGTSKSYQQGEFKNVINDILNGKKIGFIGDSITMGSDVNTIGYVEQIQRITGCITQNLAVDGGTLASGTTIVTTGSNRFHICEHLEDFDENTDMYCISGGYNDWGIGQVSLGTYSDELNSDYTVYDTTTLYGALDYIFTWLMVNRSGKPIMYVITHNPLGYRTSGGSGETANITLKEWNEAIKKTLNKYSIPYVDLFSNTPLLTKFDVLKPFTVNNDGVHPNTEGYKRYYVPQILDSLRKICPIEFE